MHPAVDVAVQTDLDGGEVPGHRAGRRDRLVHRDLGRARAAEHDPPPVAPADGTDPQVGLRPSRSLQLAQGGQLLGDVVPAGRDQGHAGRQRPEPPRPDQRALQHVPIREPQGTAQGVQRVEGRELGHGGAGHVVEDAAAACR